MKLLLCLMLEFFELLQISVEASIIFTQSPPLLSISFVSIFLFFNIPLGFFFVFLKVNAGILKGQIFFSLAPLQKGEGQQNMLLRM